LLAPMTVPVCVLPRRIFLLVPAMRNLRFALEEGEVDAQRALATALSRAVVQVSLD